MPKSPTPWQDKLNKNSAPVIKEGPEQWNERFGGAKMLIANPALIQEKLDAIPLGKVLTMSQLRSDLAADFNADYTCPLTTGIFARIVAEAAEGAKAQGKQLDTPWWRLVRDDGKLNPKFPGNGATQARLLESEGHTVIPAGKSNFKITSLSN